VTRNSAIADKPRDAFVQTADLQKSRPSLYVCQTVDESKSNRNHRPRGYHRKRQCAQLWAFVWSQSVYRA